MIQQPSWSRCYRQRTTVISMAPVKAIMMHQIDSKTSNKSLINRSVNYKYLHIYDRDNCEQICCLLCHPSVIFCQSVIHSLEIPFSQPGMAVATRCQPPIKHVLPVTLATDLWNHAGIIMISLVTFVSFRGSKKKKGKHFQFLRLLAANNAKKFTTQYFSVSPGFVFERARGSILLKIFHACLRRAGARLLGNVWLGVVKIKKNKITAITAEKDYP